MGFVSGCRFNPNEECKVSVKVGVKQQDRTPTWTVFKTFVAAFHYTVLWWLVHKNPCNGYH